MKPSFQKMKPFERAISIIDLFSIDRKKLTFNEIVRLTGLPKSTVSRMINKLLKNDLLALGPDGKALILGPWFLSKIGLVINQNVVASSSMSMRRLWNLTKETVCLWGRIGNDRVCLWQIESPQELRMTAQLGIPVPLYAGGAGKLFLAYFSSAELDHYFAEVSRESLGPETITDEKKLRLELSKIKEEGIAIGKKERTSNGVGVAAPIHTPNGCVDYCISLYFPDFRFNSEIREKTVLNLKQAAQEVSSYLGHQVPKASF